MSHNSTHTRITVWERNNMERGSEGMVPDTTIGKYNNTMRHYHRKVCEGDMRAASSETWRD